MGFLRQLLPVVHALAQTPGVTPDRYDFVEIFSGDRAISQGLELHGYHGVSVDQRYGPQQDFLTKEGFLLVLAYLLMTK